MARELEVESKNLRKRLAEQDQVLASRNSATDILTQFIHDGHAEIDDHGQVRLLPNSIRNEESMM